MYLFALSPWACWLLASLNIVLDNYHISVFYWSLHNALHTLPSITHFTFCSCTSSSPVCFVKMSTSVSSHFPPRYRHLSGRFNQPWSKNKDSGWLHGDKWLRWEYSCPRAGCHDRENVCRDVHMFSSSHCARFLWVYSASHDISCFVLMKSFRVSALIRDGLWHSLAYCWRH